MIPSNDGLESFLSLENEYYTEGPRLSVIKTQNKDPSLIKAEVILNKIKASLSKINNSNKNETDWKMAYDRVANLVLDTLRKLVKK